MRAQITDAQAMLTDAVTQLRGSDYSRLVLTTTLPGESDETSAFIAQLTQDLDAVTTGDYYIIGNSAMVYEMENSFDSELLLITLLTAASIFLVVVFTFRSLVIPALLVLIVQCGVFITVTVVGLQGLEIYYLALLIVECILMGATIDYGILYTSYYREMRETMSVRDALIAAYRGSIHTVLTSGSIMVLVTAVVGKFSATRPSSRSAARSPSARSRPFSSSCCSCPACSPCSTAGCCRVTCAGGCIRRRRPRRRKPPNRPRWRGRPGRKKR